MGDSMFETGDQDYGSIVGWDPHKEMIEKIIAEDRKKFPKAFAPEPQMLFVQSAREHMENTIKWAPMKQLFGPLWLAEEVAVLFSTPGVGKTALAVQIAESVARGEPIAPFDNPLPGWRVPPQRVLYIDFELTRTQFTRRYSIETEDGRKNRDHYRFSPNLLRAELFWDGKLIDGYDDFTDMLFTDIENKITEHRADVLICDNITFLSQSSTANASVAFRLMNRFQQLKKSNFISILVVAHTPKRRAHMPLTERDLQGSIDITKVADSVFALGISALATDLRYIKQIKSRNGPVKYESDNILVYRLAKFDLAAGSATRARAVRAENFFGYSFISEDDEQAHLPAPFRPLPPKRRPKLDQRRIKYAKLLAKQGLSTAAIGQRLGISKPTAHRYVANGGQDARLT